MNFIILFGPPAVGKMSVGRTLSKQLGIPLFHNHMSIEPALQFFEHGSSSFRRFVSTYRQMIFEETIVSKLDGLIFTYVWDLDSVHDHQFVEKTCNQFKDAGASVLLVELTASLEQRLYRNTTEERLQEKPSKRNIAQSESRLLRANEKHRMNSNEKDVLPFSHLLIDNTDLTPAQVTEKVIQHLNT